MVYIKKKSVELNQLSTLIFLFDGLDSKNPENQAYPTLGVYVSSSPYYTKGISFANSYFTIALILFSSW